MGRAKCGGCAVTCKGNEGMLKKIRLGRVDIFTFPMQVGSWEANVATSEKLAKIAVQQWLQLLLA